ncbi:putative Ubiquitin-activating enzyme E1 1 [Paratrimastix pyriformis]|uniref:Ubiquitin-activating enzyme E1 1 n=1 Tax=Paratrimastix pyriformis TaxID=342808 RepID=A0ABQ8UG07_9EUKA|nr:putative Ubiquitin-activating enzyme E1 1 [Paratrimastix pyriformis]
MSTRVLVCGLEHVGFEVAKILALKGVPLGLYDTHTSNPNTDHFPGDGVPQLRAPALAAFFQSLTGSTPSVVPNLSIATLQPFSTIVLSDLSLVDDMEQFDANLREVGKQLVIADCFGLFGRIFVDVGKRFEVRNMEALTGQQTEAIANIATALYPPEITTVVPHGFHTGDLVSFVSVKGVSELNGQPPVPVTVLNADVFTVPIDLRTHGTYACDGYAVRHPKTAVLCMDSLAQQRSKPRLSLAGAAPQADEEGVATGTSSPDVRATVLHLCFLAIDQARAKGQPLTGAIDAVVALNSGLDPAVRLSQEALEAHMELIDQFEAAANGGALVPLAALVGALAAKEVVKIVHREGMPLSQWLYFSASELAPGPTFEPTPTREAALLGPACASDLANMNVGLLGSGELATEVLKNLALMRVATGSGRIHLMDGARVVPPAFDIKSCDALFVAPGTPDQPRVEAVARSQRWLRDVHVQTTPHDVCAPWLVAHADLISFLGQFMGYNEVHYPDEALAPLHVLVHVPAVPTFDSRSYAEIRAVSCRKSLVEAAVPTPGSATVQLLVPHLTPANGSSERRRERGMPCERENFPYLIDHTIYWAINQAAEAFEVLPGQANQYLTAPAKLQEQLFRQAPGDKRALVATLRRSLCPPASFADCVAFARRLFEDWFVTRVRKLLDLNPAGTPFWKPPKRAPTLPVFDPTNEWHATFILRAATAYAQIYNLPVTGSPNSIEVARQAQGCDVPAAPSGSPAASEKDLDTDAWLADWRALPAPGSFPSGFALCPVPVEAPELHAHNRRMMELVTAAANIRAASYGIPPATYALVQVCQPRVDEEVTPPCSMQHLGASMPPPDPLTATATAGLACLELVKLVKHMGSRDPATLDPAAVAALFPPANPLRKWTLALDKVDPTAACQCSPLEACPAPSPWNRVVIDLQKARDPPLTSRPPSQDPLVGEILDYVSERRHVNVSMLAYGRALLYTDFIDAAKQKVKRATRLTEMVTAITKEPLLPGTTYLDLEASATDADTDEDVEVPPLRVIIPKVPAAPTPADQA